MVAVSRRTMFGLAGGAAALVAARPAIARTRPMDATSAIPFGPDAGQAFLARNENPYGPSPAAIRAIADSAGDGCWYANRGEARLRAMLAERFALPDDHVLLGAGSTEVLNCATMAFGRSGHILAPDLFFDAPVAYAQRHGAAVVRVPLAADMQIDLAAMAAAITPETRLVHLCNPNNPTGLLLEPAALGRFAAALPPSVTLLVDEAYNELTDRPGETSLVPLVKAGGNVIVARTFSKIHGLAGLRIGYVLARPDIIARLKPWGMSVGGNTAGLAAAAATLDDRPFLAMSKARIVEARAMIVDAATRAGLRTLPSATNFVFVNVPDAEAVRARLEDRGIIIRPPYGHYTTWSRVSAGRLEDVARYAAALPAVVGG